MGVGRSVCISTVSGDAPCFSKPPGDAKGGDASAEVLQQTVYAERLQAATTSTAGPPVLPPFGHGCVKWPTGDSYEGQFTSGELQGHGAFLYADGGRYVGEWLASERHGEGTMFYTGGAEYRGTWRRGKRHGRGDLFYADGSWFRGSYKEDILHGYGSYVSASGDRFEGGYEQGQRHGLAKCLYADGRAEISAVSSGALVGPGVRWSADRRRAWELQDGHTSGELKLSRAAELAKELGFEGAPKVREAQQGTSWK